jgi:hypothetical protein
MARGASAHLTKENMPRHNAEWPKSARASSSAGARRQDSPKYVARQRPKRKPGGVNNNGENDKNDRSGRCVRNDDD